MVQLEFEDRKGLLKDIPFFKGIPHDAACNNHRRDGNIAVDKVHKSWENATLNILRMLAVIDAKLVDPQATPFDVVLDTIAPWPPLPIFFFAYKNTANKSPSPTLCLSKTRCLKRGPCIGRP